MERSLGWWGRKPSRPNWLAGMEAPLSLPSSPVSVRPLHLLLLLILTIALLTLLLFSYGAFPSALGSAPSSRELHFAIVLDAGSSGTRAYLYSWPEHSGDRHELLKISPLLQDGEPMVKKASPGLSSMGETPDNAFEYLRPLLTFASNNIPKEKHKETPLYILATAGMRLLEKEKQDAVLANVRKGIRENFEFYFPEGHLEIISGKQEGIYQWLSINYVLGKFQHAEHLGKDEELVAVEPSGHENSENLVFRPRTVGALDMGGASMQAAMEITTNLQLEGMPDKDKAQVAEINLGCQEHDTEHTYRIFVTTFLGYGANEARARHHRKLFLTSLLSEGAAPGQDVDHRLKDPCRPLGMKDNISLTFDVPSLRLPRPDLLPLVKESQIVHFYGTGDWELCHTSLSNFTAAAEDMVECKESCPDPGIRPPPIQFDNSEFYGFSEFWYTMDDVLGMGGQYMFSKYKQAAKQFCATKWHHTWTRFLQGSYPNSDVERLQTQCFKSVWVATALHQGLTFPLNYGHLTAAPNTVHGEVVHWTLGALLYRTRFFPLRAIEADGGAHHGTYHSKSEAGSFINSSTLPWLIVILLFIGIAIYIIRLRKYMKPSTLRKVPSLNYWMPLVEDEEQGLMRQEQTDYLFAHTKVYVG